MSNNERAKVIQRTAVRGVVLTPERRVLLMQLREPVSGFEIWQTPGGGLDAGEDAVAGLERELLEETGLSGVEIGSLMWTRDHAFEWNGRRVFQQEMYYLVETERFEPNGDSNPDAGEQAWFLGFGWWQAEEILTSDQTFSPRQLGHYLAQVIRHGPPATPVEIGI
ncbi:MAG: hypothetical protein ETSY2_20010 [Candidatus Entotheonella gemina]|uniref:Nudix hydrolase domain-containing protein n=1 Tax=Candidatus Entotheonella gemina TaxID=1429439 RepID=W4M6W8_9BACT|nr:MAG: hypothetical protein ETSY2_20010 [Candidatus Entotheonella gemina]